MGKLKSRGMLAAALAVAIMAAAGSIDVFITAEAVRHGYAPSKSSKEGVGPGLQLRALTALKESKRAKARAPPCTRGPFTLRGGNKLWNEWRAYNGTGSAASIISSFLFSRSCRFAQPTLCHFQLSFSAADDCTEFRYILQNLKSPSNALFIQVVPGCEQLLPALYICIRVR